MALLDGTAFVCILDYFGRIYAYAPCQYVLRMFEPYQPPSTKTPVTPADTENVPEVRKMELHGPLI